MSSTKPKSQPITPSYVRDSIDRYQKNSVKRIVIIFYMDTDAEIITKLNSLKNMSGYIKDLITSDIALNPEYVAAPKDLSVLRRYNSSEKKRVNVLVNRTDEAAILERLVAQSNMSDYIKGLINKDLSLTTA